MKRKILLASVNPWWFSLAVERDLARRHANAQVDLLDLFRHCGTSSPHWRRRDVMIERVNRKIARFVKPAITGRDMTDRIATDPGMVPPVPADSSGLRTYRVGAAAVGLSILSSVTSITTVQDPVASAEYGPAFAKAWRSAHLSQQAGAAVAGLGYDEVHIFNGRHCHSRPFCDEVTAAGGKVVVYEQGAAGDRYIEADRPIPHPEVHAELIQAHPFSEAVGEAFFADRFANAPGDPVNFYRARQQTGVLPVDLAPQSYVAFFTSSSDEMFAITDEVGFGDFPTQYALAVEISRAARSQGKRLVVRLHPHLSYKHSSWRREWDFDRLEAEGALIIAPDDPCDSYALAGGAHCVLTCGSTVGFECSVRGIPNADLGDWVGGRLGAMRALLTAADIHEFVAAPSLPDGARRAALSYGSFWRSAGRLLPELDPGSHPNYARIGGRVVDPVRYAVQRVRDLLTGAARERQRDALGGKVLVDPNLRDRASRELAKS